MYSMQSAMVQRSEAYWIVDNPLSNENILTKTDHTIQKQTHIHTDTYTHIHVRCVYISIYNEDVYKYVVDTYQKLRFLITRNNESFY